VNGDQGWNGISILVVDDEGEQAHGEALENGYVEVITGWRSCLKIREVVLAHRKFSRARTVGAGPVLTIHNDPSPH
jgi:hypothetical protein